MIGAAGEIVLARKAKPQPAPEIHPGGDCGACALGGALEMEAAAVYEAFSSKGITSHGEMARCIRCAAIYGKADRMIDTHAEWSSQQPFRQFGSPSVLEYVPWFNYVRMAVDAGYYGLAEVDYDGSVPQYETNHWVLICGARTGGVVTGEIIGGEILVSCSAGRLNGWHDAREFLKSRGGYDLLFVRPA